MRNFLLTLSPKAQLFLITIGTVLVAFITAIGINFIFNQHDTDLLSKTGLITSIYQVLGTIYAVLIAFAVSGVWQNYCAAELAVANEVASLTDLIHMTKGLAANKMQILRDLAINYIHEVIDLEWPTLGKGKNKKIMSPDSTTYGLTMDIIHEVQAMQPQDARDNVIFSHVLTLSIKWLDARRTRIMIAKGNIAKSLWPLLMAGAVILFAFHGLFIVENRHLWSTLLLFFSGIIGLAFYLIFTLDAPFSGVPSINAEPFEWALIWFRYQKNLHENKQ